MNKDNGGTSKTQAIAWRDGKKKEAVVSYLNSPGMLERMPEDIRGNIGEMVVWAVRKLSDVFYEDAVKKSTLATLGGVRLNDAGTHHEHHQKLHSIISEVFGVEPTRNRIQVDFYEANSEFPLDIIVFSYQISVPKETFRGSMINELSKKVEVSLDRFEFYPHDGTIDIHWCSDEVF